MVSPQHLTLTPSFSKEIRILLKSGQVLKEHKTKYPIVVHVLEGEINFGVEDLIHTMKSGGIISLEGNVAHDLTAIQDSVIRLSLFKLDNVERVEKVAKASI